MESNCTHIQEILWSQKDITSMETEKGSHLADNSSSLVDIGRTGGAIHAERRSFFVMISYSGLRKPSALLQPSGNMRMIFGGDFTDEESWALEGPAGPCAKLPPGAGFLIARLANEGFCRDGTAFPCTRAAALAEGKAVAFRAVSLWGDVEVGDSGRGRFSPRTMRCPRSILHWSPLCMTPHSPSKMYCKYVEGNSIYGRHIKVCWMHIEACWRNF